jgi:hypothetical protein
VLTNYPKDHDAVDQDHHLARMEIGIQYDDADITPLFAESFFVGSDKAAVGTFDVDAVVPVDLGLLLKLRDREPDTDGFWRIGVGINAPKTEGGPHMGEVFRIDASDDDCVGNR